MSEFEGVFDELNIQTANIDGALDDVYGSGIPQADASQPNNRSMISSRRYRPKQAWRSEEIWQALERVRALSP